jgi:hypothetical protein
MRAITFEICWSFARRHTRNEDEEVLVVDLINRCKEEYALPEQDQDSGELLHYGLYCGEGYEKQQLPAGKSLRELQVRNADRLYLAPRNALWWQDHPALAAEPPIIEPADLRQAPADHSPPARCEVELAPGCIRPVPPSGLTLSRALLISQLPRTTLAFERARTWIGLPSRLEYVSNAARGHCAITWNRGWYVIAHRPVYLAGAKYEGGAAVPVERTSTLLLGRNGWPVALLLAGSLP